MSLKQAALGEPLAVAVYSCIRTKITFGDTVLICGAGTMGLLSMVSAKMYGAQKVAIFGK